MKINFIFNRFILLLLMLCALPHSSRAQEGWPAGYEGVMLQGFYWDSYKQTSWKTLTAQSDELSEYFDLIWVPNSGNCQKLSMGYDPIWWFKHDSSFGTEAELRDMIKTFKLKGTGIIEDVVINHKNGVTNWCDFANEEWNGNNITWTMADICSTDECKAEHGDNPTGNPDDGDDFNGCRDLDHRSANVQKNVKVYLDFLLNDLGYAGFRYDMVKGYAGSHTKDYNTAAKPQFSVGEYWDASFDNVKSWIEATGRTSAAFDFPMKYQINAAFNNNNWGALQTKGLAADCSEGGMNRYAVTFVDNHDTYRNENKLGNNQMAANAFILAMPGTPCIFWPHWVEYKEALKAIIKARKAAGISNTSKIERQEAFGGGYVVVVNGSKGSVLCMSGFVNGFDTTGWKLVNSGTNYAYYVSDNVDLGEGEVNPNPVPVQKTNKLYLKPNTNWLSDQARFVAYFFDPINPSQTEANVWVDMNEEENNYYSVDRRLDYKKVIFCRMNPNTSENNWNNKWNQTPDLDIAYDNCYNVPENTWDKGSGYWNMYNALYVDFQPQAEGYSTLYADFAVEIPEGVEVYTGKIANDKLVLTPYVGKILPEKMAVVLKGDIHKYLFNRSFEAVDGVVAENDLKGNWVDTTSPVDKIICTLQKGKKSGSIGFYKFTGTTLKGNRAYLELPLNSSIQALRFIFDESTGIEKVGEVSQSSIIYDLSGRSLKHISHNGINIVNGKKIWIN